MTTKTTPSTRFTGCSGSTQYGVWWFRIFGYGLQFKAPWSKMLFSERNGYEKFIGTFGWRMRWLKP